MLLTLADVALILRTSKHTVYNMIQSGHLPGFQLKLQGEDQIRGGWRVHQEDLKAFLIKQQTRLKPFEELTNDSTDRKERMKYAARKQRATAIDDAGVAAVVTNFIDELKAEKKAAKNIASSDEPDA